jgi:hypothetical protein
MHGIPLLAALLGLVLAGSPAAAQTLRAVYDVHALGMTVLELHARIEVSAEGYKLQTTARTRGIASALVPGEQLTRVEGMWNGLAVLPAVYRSEGAWRGRPRRTALDWQAGAPVIRELVPPESEEMRETVPPDLRRGTIDGLSAMAALSQVVARTGACEVRAPVFDGRRLSNYVSRTGGREMILPWRSAWHGEALRCSFEGRLVAGLRRDQSPEEAATPVRVTAWIAAPFPGAPPIPVRADIPSRWFGQATAVLLRAEPAPQAGWR